MTKRTVPAIKHLYPDLTNDQLNEAEDNLDSYLEIVWRIAQRIHDDPDEHARFQALTQLRPNPYDEGEKVDAD